MTLNELKKLVAEEYTAYKRKLNEQGMPPMDMGAPDMPGVSVSDMDVDATGGGDAEGTLQKIFDILSDYFEGGADDEAGADDAGADDADVDDAGADDADADDEEDDEDIEEGMTNHGLGKAAKKSSGKNAGYKTVKESRSRLRKGKKFIAEAKMKSRFQKLANIKK